MNPITVLLGLLVLGLIFSGGAPDDVWTLEYPFNLIITSVEKGSRERSVKGFNEFWKAAQSFAFSKERRTKRGWSRGGRSGYTGGYSLVGAVEQNWGVVEDFNTIFIIPPKDIQQVEELEAKYPNLVPLPYDELKQYSYPLLYFARDSQTDRVRGLIIIDELNVSLAKLLAERGVPLDTPFRYENGQVQVLEAPVEILTSK